MLAKPQRYSSRRRRQQVRRGQALGKKLPARQRTDRQTRRFSVRQSSAGRSHGHARNALSKFRQATMLAVAVTSLLFIVVGGGRATGQDSGAVNGEASEDATQVPVHTQDGDQIVDPQQSLSEATSTIRSLFADAFRVLPKVAVAVGLLLLAWLVSWMASWLIHRLGNRWERSEAVAALTRIAIFLVAIGAGLSVISGDATALVGSVGLVGLALSWALQTPIESFTGWVLNALRGYYRTGDRIEVGDVFGDVYRIDVLTTTVWEAGGQDKSVAGAQPTGALVTFPNWEILRSNIINYSRDFPFVWDEVTVSVANESDLRYTMSVLERAAASLLGEMMSQPAAQYSQLLERRNLAQNVHTRPEVFLSLTDSWTNCTVRYLVPLRERRRWSTLLIAALSEEMSNPEHADRIIGGYPRSNVALVEGKAGADERK